MSKLPNSTLAGPYGAGAVFLNSLALLLASQTVQAAEGVPAIEEVVVTAQKREENLQDVPIAITALSAKALESKAVQNVTELSDFAPNVQMDNTSPFSGSSQVLTAFIRGIGQNDFAFNLEPGVGLYVDGVYYARTLGAAVDLLDLERVEILKGPQGTLFGRNTIGGAISVVTRDPSRVFDYKAELTAGRFSRFDLRASLDVPLIENTLLSQISVSSSDRDGHQDLIPFPGASQTQLDQGVFRTARNQKGSATRGSADTQNVRAKLLWNASPTLRVRLSADYTHTDEDSAPQTLLATNTAPTSGTIAALYNTCISLPVSTLTMLNLAAACGPRGVAGTALAGVNVDSNPDNDRLLFGDQFITGDIDKSFAAGSNFSLLDAYGVSATVDWEINDAITLKSISAYRDTEADFGTDIGGAPFVVADVSFIQNQDQFTQELQFTGSFVEDRLKWLLGLYYFQEDGTLTDFVPFLAGLVQVLGPNFFDNKATGAFTQLDFALTEKIGLTAGVRYTDEDKEFEGRQRDLNMLPVKTGFPLNLFPDPNDLTRLYPLGVNQRNFTDTSLRLGAQYRFTDEILTYVSYSEGFKSGGFTTRLLVPEVAVVNGVMVPGPAPDFDPETAETVEVGLKSQLLDSRLQLNLAVFDTRYDDIQVTVQRGISPTFENAGDGKITGAELEVQSVLGSNLQLSGSLGYIDARYSRLEPGSQVELGDMFVNTPEWSTNLSADYAVRLGAGNLMLHGDWSNKSKVANDAVNNPLFVQSAINLYNASIGFAPTGGAWEVRLGGRNLSDERYIVSGFQNDGIGVSTAVFSRPREWYLTLRIKGK
jgi:iron complex outermembrane receptor protein